MGKKCKENWGMGFLLVLFPEDTSSSSTSINVDKSSSSSSSFSNPMIRRTSSNRLVLKAQSTISICALLVFVTLLLFTLSTFEPNSRPTPNSVNLSSRRFLSQNSTYFSSIWKKTTPLSSSSRSKSSRALQGLGTLYRRGTRAVADLIVAHVAEDSTAGELRVFLRALHKSGVTAKSDLVFLFPNADSQARFGVVIGEENELWFRKLNGTKQGKVKPGKKEPAGEAIWGKKGNVNSSVSVGLGSVVGFEASELDPENSLSGFFTAEHGGVIPISLRRWACYPMLLGRVRRSFKNVALVSAKSVVVLGDQLGLVRNRSPETVHFYTGSRHGKKSHGVSAAVIAGGARGVRRLAAAMVSEIVRAATGLQHKRKGGTAVADSAVLSQLVGNEFLLKDVHVVKSGESVPEASEVGRGGANSASLAKIGVVHCGNGGNGHEVIKAVIMKQICSDENGSFVYKDCQQKS